MLILFFSEFTFYNEALPFILFKQKMLTFGSISEYIRQKFTKHAHFKISSQDEVLFSSIVFFFFFYPGMKFHSCLFDGYEFIPGWSFISAKACKQSERSHHRQRLFHPETSFILGWNFTRKHTFRGIIQFIYHFEDFF